MRVISKKNFLAESVDGGLTYGIVEWGLDLRYSRMGSPGILIGKKQKSAPVSSFPVNLSCYFHLA